MILIWKMLQLSFHAPGKKKNWQNAKHGQWNLCPGQGKSDFFMGTLINVGAKVYIIVSICIICKQIINCFEDL